GTKDMYRSRRHEGDLRPLVGVRREPRWAWRFRWLAGATQFDDRLAHDFDPQASCRQHFGRDATLLAQQPEQQMFGADEFMRQLVGFVGGVLQRALAGGAEGHSVGLRDRLAAGKTADDVAAKVVEGNTRPREDAAADPLAFVQQPEEDVLGLDGARPEQA